MAKKKNGRPKQNEIGKRIWLPGEPQHIAAVEAAAREHHMRIGQWLMICARCVANKTLNPAA